MPRKRYRRVSYDGRTYAILSTKPRDRYTKTVLVWVYYSRRYTQSFFSDLVTRHLAWVKEELAGEEPNMMAYARDKQERGHYLILKQDGKRTAEYYKNSAAIGFDLPVKYFVREDAITRLIKLRRLLGN